jgi:hypothetical protein
VDGRPAPGIAQPLVAPLQLVEHARHPRDDGADLMLSWDRLARPIRDEARAIRLGDVAFGKVAPQARWTVAPRPASRSRW